MSIKEEIKAVKDAAGLQPTASYVFKLRAITCDCGGMAVFDEDDVADRKGAGVVSVSACHGCQKLVRHP